VCSLAACLFRAGPVCTSTFCHEVLGSFSCSNVAAEGHGYFDALIYRNPFGFNVERLPLAALL